MILQKLNKILFLSIVFVIFACSKTYKYEIFGKVDTKKGKKDAVWYSDTIIFDTDIVFYVNSDNSVVKIYPPFIIKQNY